MSYSSGTQSAAVTLDAIDKLNPAAQNPAVARCYMAWKTVFREAALPSLSTRENCRDFNACVAYGVAIGAIPEKHAGKLLYAAQIALSSFANEPKTIEIRHESAQSKSSKRSSRSRNHASRTKSHAA